MNLRPQSSQSTVYNQFTSPPLMEVSEEILNEKRQQLIRETEAFIAVPEDIIGDIDGGDPLTEEEAEVYFQGSLQQLRKKRYEAELYLNTERHRNRDCSFRRIDCYGETTLEHSFELLFDITKRSFTALSAEGDGRCLLNSISRSLVGCECLTNRLKSLIMIEVLSNLDHYFYKNSYSSSLSLYEFEQKMISPLRLTSQDFMEEFHIRALANVLDAPIITLDSLTPEIIEDGGTSLLSSCILPSRISVREEDEEIAENKHLHDMIEDGEDTENKQKKRHPAIIIAWQNNVTREFQNTDNPFERKYGHLLGTLPARGELCYGKYQHFICVVPTMRISRKSFLINIQDFDYPCNMEINFSLNNIITNSTANNNNHNNTQREHGSNNIHPLRLLCADPTAYLVKQMTLHNISVINSNIAPLVSERFDWKISNGYAEERKNLREMIKSLLIAPRWMQLELTHTIFPLLMNNIGHRFNPRRNEHTLDVLIKLPKMEYNKYNSYGLANFFQFFNLKIACRNATESLVDGCYQTRDHIYMGYVMDSTIGKISQPRSQQDCIVFDLITKTEMELKVKYMTCILMYMRLWNTQITFNRLYAPLCTNAEKKYLLISTLMTCWEELFCFNEKIAINLYNLTVDNSADKREAFIKFLIDLFDYIVNFDKIDPIVDEEDVSNDLEGEDRYKDLAQRCLNLFLSTKWAKEVLSAIGYKNLGEREGGFYLYPIVQGKGNLNQRETLWYYSLNITREDIPKFLELLISVERHIVQVPLCFDSEVYEENISVSDEQLKRLGIPPPVEDPTNYSDGNWIFGKPKEYGDYEREDDRNIRGDADANLEGTEDNEDSIEKAQQKESLSEHLEFLSQIDEAIFSKWMMLQNRFNQTSSELTDSVGESKVDIPTNRLLSESQNKLMQEEPQRQERFEEGDKEKDFTDIIRIPSNPNVIEKCPDIQQRDQMRSIFFQNQPTIQEKEIQTISENVLSRQNSTETSESVEEISDPENDGLLFCKSHSILSKEASIRSTTSTSSRRIHYTAVSDEIIYRPADRSSDGSTSLDSRESSNNNIELHGEEVKTDTTSSNDIG